MRRLRWAGVVAWAVACAAGGAELWTTRAHTDVAGTRLVIDRVLAAPPADAERARHPVRMTVRWAYRGIDGQPASADAARMDAFEAAAKPLVERGGAAELVAVVTGDDCRRWTYYAASERLFRRRLRAVLPDPALASVSVDADSDPAWTAFLSLRGQGSRKPR